MPHRPSDMAAGSAARGNRVDGWQITSTVPGRSALFGGLLTAAVLLQLDDGVRAGRVLDPSQRFSLHEDGLTLLPGALSAAELEELNSVVRRAVWNLENNTQELSTLALTKLARANEKTRRSHGAIANSLFCFGDITQRDPGKYEARAFYDPERQEDVLPPVITNSPRWLPAVHQELGRDAQLRSATVILSTANAMVTNETATTQAWHSDGTLGKDSKGDLVSMTYALVVYIPLESVPEDGGRVEYLPRTHKDLDLRVDKYAGEWSEDWGADKVVPPMQAGTAAIYSFATMHRGLASAVPGFYRPVLKLDYFSSRVTANDNKDGWCEANGFVTAPQQHF